jgi:cytochrome P450
VVTTATSATTASSASSATSPATHPWIGTTAPRAGALGVLPELSRDALGLLTRCTRDHGDFVRIRLGLTPAIIVGHPELIEEILVTRNHDFRKGHATRRLASLLGKGLLLSEGEFWLRQRRLMQPAFHRQRLAAMADTMVGAALQLLRTWQDGQTRFINQDMAEVTLRIVARTLFGADIGADLARIRSSSMALSVHFRSRLFSLLTLLPDRVPTPGNLRYQRAVRELDRLVARIIGERRATGQPGDDLLGMLLTARDDHGNRMHDRQLRDEVITMLLAGHDTTALALTWTWILLAQHPRVEQRLHAEVDAVLDGRPPGVADLPRLRYAEHVITETLRLYPTAWAIGREALRETHIGGQRVARGTMLLIVPWVLHRDGRFFDAAEAYRPERWDGDLASKLPRCAYLPFGAGQRVCIGSSFAHMEAVLLLATIAQRFRLELAEPARVVEPWPVVTLRTLGDVAVRLERR